MYTDQKAATAHESRFDAQAVFTTIVIPIASIVASTQVDPRSRLLLILMGIVAITYNGVPHGLRWGRRWIARRADARLAREIMPRIRTLFAGFGEFVGENDGTLHYVVRRHLTATPPAVLEALKIGDQYTMNSWWFAVNARVQAGPASIEEAVRNMSDLSALMNTYKASCLDPVFERPTPDFLASLSSEARAELESARERYLAYRARVSDTADHLVKALRSLAMPRYYFQMPKPLRSSATH